MRVRIGPAAAQHEAQWRRLWQGYNQFYQASVPSHVTDATWRRILDADGGIGCLVAEEEGRLLGFIHYVVHPRTWHDRDSCFLEDFYVDSPHRRSGVGRKLVAALRALCEQRGLSQIYWNTKESNRDARAFYDSIGTQDDMVRYAIKLA